MGFIHISGVGTVTTMGWDSTNDIELYVKICIKGTFENENLFLDYINTRAEFFIDKIKNFFEEFFNKGFEEEVVCPLLREDVEVREMGKSNEYFVKEKLLECMLFVNGYDYSEDLKNALKG